MKISAFTITTNALRWQFPIVESIKSVLPMVDEIIVVDGWSNDGTVDVLRNLSDKIKIIRDKDTEWEDDWTYWRMGYNYDCAFRECSGDWVMKFDADYVFKERFDLGMELKMAELDGCYSLDFDRYNFQLIDRYFKKSKKTMFVNMKLCRSNGINVRWGYDLKRNGLGDGPIVFKGVENKLNVGDMLRSVAKKSLSKIEVFNYAYCFRDIKKSKELMFRNMRAMRRQLNESHKSKDDIFNMYKTACLSAFEKSKQFKIGLSEHPKFITDRIMILTDKFQGFNFWGEYETAGYYGKN